MSVDQAREEWQAAGDYDSACRLIRAQAARIEQLERELVAERKVRALKAQVVGLERDLADMSQRLFEEGEMHIAVQRELSAEKALADAFGRDVGEMIKNANGYFEMDDG